MECKAGECPGQTTCRKKVRIAAAVCRIGSEHIKTEQLGELLR